MSSSPSWQKVGGSSQNEGQSRFLQPLEDEDENLMLDVKTGK